MCMCIDNYNVHMYICICVRLCIDLWCKITWWSWQLQNHINIYMSFTITIYKDPSFPAKPLYSPIKTCSKQNKLTKTWITNHTIIKNTHAHTNTCVCVCARLRQEIVPEQWCCANRVVYDLVFPNTHCIVLDILRYAFGMARLQIESDRSDPRP